MRQVRTLLSLAAALVLAAPLVAISSAHTDAQNANAATVVAAGLMNPRGFTWGDDGSTLFVAEAGSGGTTPGNPVAPAPFGPLTGGKTARVSWISNGCPATLADKLPSYIAAIGEVGGAADVAILDKTIYVLVTGGGAVNGNPDTPSGIYTADGSGNATLLVDLGEWLRKHPVAKVPTADYSPEGSWFDLLAKPDGSGLLVTEANSQQLLEVTPGGQVSRVADLSGDNQVPTAVALGPNGELYVGYLSGLPYPNGAAKVVQIDASGTATDVWTGLTNVTGLAVEADGTLLASEMSTGNTAAEPFLVENSGKIVRQTGPGTAEDVVTDLNLPTHLEIGPDGALYVAAPAIGAQDGSGYVVRIDASGTTPVSAANAVPAADACGVPVITSSPSPEAAANEYAVSIYDFGFDPPLLTIPAGSTVTWTNTGAVQHTTVSFDKGKKTWDSDIMDPGATFSFTFDNAGTYNYLCGLHPDMKAVIVVTE